MSKTIKRLPPLIWRRRVTGRRQALVAGVRPKAVPPAHRGVDRESLVALRVASGMRESGRSDGEISKRMKCFGVLERHMEWVLDDAESSRLEVPDGCLAIYGEKRGH